MYPGYSQDRRALGYGIIKDSSSEKELFTVILIFFKKSFGWWNHYFKI